MSELNIIVFFFEKVLIPFVVFAGLKLNNAWASGAVLIFILEKA